MGNDQSSQATVEHEQPETAAERHIASRNDFEDSSEDENSNTSKISLHPENPAPEPEPEPPPPRVSMKGKGSNKRKAQITAQMNVQEDKAASLQDEQENDPTDMASQATADSAAIAESSDGDVQREDEVVYPYSTEPSLQVEEAAESPSEAEDAIDRPTKLTTSSKSLQIRLDDNKGRFACPKAQTFNCTKSFASAHTANRHVHTHFKRTFQCPVCQKALSRQDKLKRHKLGHSKEDLEQAEAKATFKHDNNEDGVNRIGTATPVESSPSPSESGSNEEYDNVPGSKSTHEISRVLAANGTEDQSSSKVSASSASIFDESVDTERVEETPRPRFRLKRKRNALEPEQAGPKSPEISRKRRRRHSLSPPSSVSSGEEMVETSKSSRRSNNKVPVPMSVPKSTKPKTAKLGNLDNFAKPWTPGSQLHHPIHNPRSPRVASTQRVQVVIPQSSRAESSKRTAAQGHGNPFTLSSDTLIGEPTPLARRGQKAVYTSPKGKSKARDGVAYSSPSGRVKSVDESDYSEPEGMATSVARRGNFSGKGRKRVRDEVEEHETDGVEGRKGAFSAHEVRKLEKWRDAFCDDYDIDTPTFNQMMTDSCRRVQGVQWPYRFISKNDFLKEYYDTLPDRDRRSMHRYRERAFQNVPEKQEWTKEDDEELVHLVKEIGQKWVEIGQRMTRTQDSVNQRWRFKLQHTGELNQGEWLKSEEEKLKEAVAQVKRESGLPLDPNADVRIPWDSVSKRLKGKRTPQQCSNKWRLMYQKRSGNKFFKPGEEDDKSATPSVTGTPSKMSQRLSGQPSSALRSSSVAKKKFVSDERVHDSDDSDDKTDDDKDGGENGDMLSSNMLKERTKEEDKSTKNLAGQRTRSKASAEAIEAETPVPRRKNFPVNTPQPINSLSQAFAQTQANTSASRAPNTIHKQQTQTTMPTPGLPIQHRPSSSPWLAINRNGSQGETTLSQTRVDLHDNEDAIMAEPDSSEAETSKTESTDSSSEDSEDDGKVGDQSKSSTKSASEGSSTSDTEESDDDDDDMISGTQKDSFVQSLTSPANAAASSSKSASQGVRRKGSTKIDWNRVIHGTISQSESESEDEGDIDHH